MDFRREVISIRILGSSEVGKTCVSRRFIEDKFTQEFYATIGYNILRKKIKINIKDIEKDITLKIVDKTGSERLFSSSIVIVKSCLGILLVYSITD